MIKVETIFILCLPLVGTHFQSHVIGAICIHVGGWGGGAPQTLLTKWAPSQNE